MSQQLDFSGGIQADILPGDVFSSIANLNVTTVNFTDVNVKNISEKVFPKLKSLRILDFTDNPLARDSLIKITSTLGETSIEELYLENTCIGIHDAINQILDNLSDTKIKVLSLDRNNIHNMKGFCSSLPHIENLTITHNGLYDFVSLLEDCHLKLDISYQNMFLESDCKRSSRNQVESLPDRNRNVNFNYCLYGNVCAIIWPRKLEWIALSYCQWN